MNNKIIKCRPIISLLIVGVLVAVDQFTKVLAYNYLSNTPSGVSVINGVFSLYYTPNTGISLSLLAGKTVLIIAITSVILLLLIYALIRTPKLNYYMPFSVVLSVIIAGAVGNLIDRIFRGFVIDFISLDIIHFPIFNVADICVTVGLVILVFLVIFKYKDEDFVYIFGKGK